MLLVLAQSIKTYTWFEDAVSHKFSIMRPQEEELMKGIVKGKAAWEMVITINSIIDNHKQQTVNLIGRN